MKTQIRKPVTGKTVYGEEYKQQAVERWQSSGRSAAKVGAELDIRPALLFRWAAVGGQAMWYVIETAAIKLTTCHMA